MYLSIDGLKINYEEKGSGEKTIFLLHGWGCNLTLFYDLMDFLSKKYRVIAADFPGFGASDEPLSPFCVDDYVDFIIKFIAQFNCDEVSLLGHSFGGRVIIKLAARENIPFKIDKIILTGSAGIRPKKKFLQKLKSLAFKAGKKFLSIPLVSKFAPGALESLRKKFGSADYLSATEMMRKTLVLVVNEDLTPYLEKIKAPALLIWGENDTETPLTDGKIMESKISDAGLVVLKNAGHYAFLEQKAAFNRIIGSFMGV